MHNGMHTIVHQGKTLSIGEYASELARTGTRIVAGSSGTFWVRYESGAMVRIPTFHLAPPAQDEVQRVQWGSRAALVSYLREPDERRPANALLYVCSDRAYALD